MRNSSATEFLPCYGTCTLSHALCMCYACNQNAAISYLLHTNSLRSCIVFVHTEKIVCISKTRANKNQSRINLGRCAGGWESCEGCPLSEPVADMHGCWHAFCGTWCMWPLPLSSDRELPCHLAGGMPTLFWIGLSNSHYPWWGPQRPHPCAGCLLTMGWSCRWLFRAHRWISHVLGYPRPLVQRPVTMQ